MSLVSMMSAWKTRDAHEGYSAWKSEVSALMKLAAPQAGAQLAQLAIFTTDILMIGQLGAEALAAASLGVTVFYLAWLTGFGPTLAVSPVVSQILGARPDEREEVRATAIAGLWSIAFVSLPLMVALLFAEDFLLLIGQDGSLSQKAGEFVAILGLGLPFAIGIALLRSFSAALSRPNAAFIVTLVMIGVNALGNYALIWGYFGMPEMGFMGSAWASTITNLAGFLILLAWITWRTPFAKYRILSGTLWPDRTKLKELFQLGVPMGLTVAFEGALFNAGVLIVGWSGPVQLAAHQIAINVASLVFMVPLGIALAATVRVGLHAGAGNAREVRHAGWAGIALAGAFMVLAGLVTLTLAKPIAALYLSEDTKHLDEVLNFAQSFMIWAAIFMVADGLQVTGAMALRGLKDAHGPMWIAAISYWVIGFPTCWILAEGLGMGGEGVWIGYAVSLVTVAIGMLARFWWLTRGSELWRPASNEALPDTPNEQMPHL